MLALLLAACDGSAKLGDDLDGDGFPEALDCAEGDPDVYPGAPEICRDGKVNDCDDTDADARTFCALWREIYAETASTILVGANRGDRAGAAAVALGDVDGDDVPDVAVGAPGYGSNGAVLVVSGVERGRDDLDVALSAWDGEDAGETGAALAPAGDVDGDGFGDLFLAAPGTGSQDGWVYLLTNLAEGGSTDDAAASWRGESGAGTALAAGDLDGDGTADVVIGSPLEGGDAGAVYVAFGDDDAELAIAGEGRDAVGSGVATGDLDGDGVDELIVGLPGWDDRGAVAIRQGPVDGEISAADADILLEGEDSEGLAGIAVASGQDADGDGRDDLIVGASGHEDHGAAWLLTEASSGSLPTVAAGQVDAIRAGDGAGGEVAFVGDVDGDGMADLGIGAPEVQKASGSAYVVFGPLRGLLELYDADIQIITAYDEDRLGAVIASAGDLDGDGRDDLLLGSQERGDPDPDVGVVWFFLAAPI